MKFSIENLISSRITVSGTTVTPTSVASSPDTNPSMSFSCSLSSNILNCGFSCLVAPNEQIVQITVPADMNPLYQDSTTMSCTLYYSTGDVATKGSITVLAPPNPRPIIIEGTSQSGVAGGLNAVSLCLTTDFQIASSSTILISNFPLQSTNSVTIKLGTTTITSSTTSTANVNSQTLSILLNMVIPNSASTKLCIENTVVQSSTVTYSNSYTMTISTSGSKLVAQTSSASWSPFSAAAFTNNGIVPSSNVVGDTGVTYDFKFTPPFTITSPLTIQFRLPTGTCTQTQSIIVCSSINLLNTCTATNCDCSFNLDSVNNQPLTQGILYTVNWKSFTNPTSTRPLNFQINVYYQTSSSMMITSTFSMNSVTTPSSFNSLALSYDPSKTASTKVDDTGYYIITFNPKVTVYAYLNIEISMPSIVDFTSGDICDTNPSNCIYSTAQVIYIKDPSNQATVNSNYVTQVFKMGNPSCAGLQAIQFTTTLYNFATGDSGYGYSSVKGTATSSFTYYGLACTTTPTISSVTSKVQGVSTTYIFDYSGCTSSPALTKIQIEFTSAYSFGTISCVCGSGTTSTTCSRVTNTNAIIVDVSSSCSGTIKIDSVINPFLTGPTDKFILKGFTGDCEKIYDTITGPTIETASTNLIFTLTTITPDSYQNLASTTYTFQFQICGGCIISQSSLVTTYLRLTWTDSSLFTCNCQSPLDSTFSYISSSSPSCTFSLGTTSVTNSVFTLKLGTCANPPSTTKLEEIQFTLLQVVKSTPTSQYISYVSNPSNIPNVKTSQGFAITITSGYSTSNTPVFPYYDSSSLITYLDLKVINNIGSLSFTLIGLEGTGSTGTISVYNQGNDLICQTKSANSNSYTFSPFPCSSSRRNVRNLATLNSQYIQVVMNNWFKNPKTQAQYSDSSNYGIRIESISLSNGALGTGSMGSILLKPPITCDYPCQQCSSSSATSCSSCYNDDSTFYLYQTNCVSDCGSSTQFKYYNSGGICVACSSGCSSCSVSGSTVTCKSCENGKLIYNNNCVTSCPTGYITASDQISCVEGSLSFLGALSAGKIVPFPFLIVAIAMIFFALAGNLRNDGNTVFIGTNILLQLSSLLLIAYLVQWILCLTLNMGMYVFGLTIFAFISMIILNVVFSILFYLRIKKEDKGYINWSDTHGIENIILVILASVFSFQNYRLIYSRYLGFTCMNCRLSSLGLYLKFMKIFTIAYIFAVNIVCIVGDIIGLCLLNWSYQLNVNIIETLIISIIVIGFALYELRFSESDSDLLFGSETDDKYSKLKDQSEIKNNTKSGVGRTRSQPNLKENKYDDFDEIKSRSHPTSPNIKSNITSKFIRYRVYSPRFMGNKNSIFNLGPQTSKKSREVLKNQINNFRKLMGQESMIDFRNKNSKYDEEEARRRREALHRSKADGLSFILPGQTRPLDDRFLDDKELLGSFDRDEYDNSILIMQGKDGRLRDKKGRQVNKYGYLTDDKGNIYRKDGSLAYTADQFDFEKEYFEPTIVSKKSLQNKNSGSVVNASAKGSTEQDNILKNHNDENNANNNLIMTQGADIIKKDRNSPEEYESYTKRSDQIDPLMEDKPSNYDQFNIRYLQGENQANISRLILNPENVLNNEKQGFEDIKEKENLEKYSQNEKLDNQIIGKRDSSLLLDKDENGVNSSQSIIYDQVLNAPLEKSYQDLRKSNNQASNNKINQEANPNFDSSGASKYGINLQRNVSGKVEKQENYLKPYDFDNKSKLREAEKVYLQRLESSASKKHHKKVFDSAKKGDDDIKNEDLDKVLENNYKSMQNHFQNYIVKDKKTAEIAEGPNIFIGNRKQYL